MVLLLIHTLIKTKPNVVFTHLHNNTQFSNKLVFRVSTQNFMMTELFYHVSILPAIILTVLIWHIKQQRKFAFVFPQSTWEKGRWLRKKKFNQIIHHWRQWSFNWGCQNGCKSYSKYSLNLFWSIIVEVVCFFKAETITLTNLYLSLYLSLLIFRIFKKRTTLVSGVRGSNVVGLLWHQPPRSLCQLFFDYSLDVEVFLS